jgi:hypothetical protein
MILIITIEKKLATVFHIVSLNFNSWPHLFKCCPVTSQYPWPLSGRMVTAILCYVCSFGAGFILVMIATYTLTSMATLLLDLPRLWRFSATLTNGWSTGPRFRCPCWIYGRSILNLLRRRLFGTFASFILRWRLNACQARYHLFLRWLPIFLVLLLTFTTVKLTIPSLTFCNRRRETLHLIC